MSFGSDGPEELAKDITREEVQAQALNLNNNKAPSPLDSINNELLKYGGQAMHTALAALFNLLSCRISELCRNSNTSIVILLASFLLCC
jgi:hypothetical protein